MDLKLKEVLKLKLKRYQEINDRISKLLASNIFNDECKELQIELKKLQPICSFYLQYLKLNEEILLNKKLLVNEKEEEFKELAKEELKSLNLQKDKLFTSIKEIIAQENQPNAELINKNIILEMRAATGGEEASIFVKDLFSAYIKFIDSFKWKYKILELSESSAGGGYSFVAIEVKGQNVYKYFQFESGVHRVQRVPKTEVKGRVHTSTISVAVLPTVDDVEVKIETKDLKIDTYRASGAGGQHVNMTDSAVRITHLPTNIVVTSQNERSQHENRSIAMKRLRAKLYQHDIDKQLESIITQRNKQIGRGMRAEKIRTYNYPQNRVTDHRNNFSSSNLDNIMNGNFLEIVESLLLYQNEHNSV